ncbi:MAG: hypothetical protein QNK03_04035 [Myxococcota bacterium]|nr:hypothetical protein [Myxococcota bacterium]
MSPDCGRAGRALAAAACAAALASAAIAEPAPAPGPWEALYGGLPPTPAVVPALPCADPSEAEPRTPACLRLESARRELARGHLPEAAAEALLAERALGDRDRRAAVRQTARFLRAEARWRAGHLDEAASGFRAIRQSADPRLRDQVALRLADAAFASGDSAVALQQYEELLSRAGPLGVSPAPWSARAAEAAFAEDRIEEGVAWLRRALDAEPTPGLTTAIQIRLAEALHGTGHIDEARELLAAARETGSPDASAFASARGVAFDLQSGPVDRLSERLAPALEGAPRVAAYGRVVLAHGLLAADEPAGAIDVLTRVLVDPHAEPYGELASDALGRALAVLVPAEAEWAACGESIARIGWRRDLLSRRAPAPEPIVQLGRCYAELGLSGTALDLFRSVVKRFGERGAEVAAFPIARASFANGDLAVAEAAARERLRQGETEDRTEWTLLLAEIELSLDAADAAVALLEPLTTAEESLPRRARALALLADAALRVPLDQAPRAALVRAVQEASEAELRGAPASYGSAALAAGDLLRRSDELEQASAIYAIAYELLPPGERREQAAYWRAALAGDASEEQNMLRESAEGGAGAWNDLARLRIDLIELLRRAGAS